MVGRGSRTVDRYSQGTDRFPRYHLQVRIARRAAPSAVQANRSVVIVDSFSRLGTACTNGSDFAFLSRQKIVVMPEATSDKSAIFRPGPTKGPSPPGPS
jgi:hypothetical protein